MAWVWQQFTGLFVEFIRNVLASLLNFPGSSSYSAEFSRKHRLFCWTFQETPVILLNFPGNTGYSAEFSRNVPTCQLSLPEMYRLVCRVCLECTGTSAENSTVLYPAWIRFDAAFVEGLVWRNLDVLQGSGNTAILLKCRYLLILIDKILL